MEVAEPNKMELPNTFTNMFPNPALAIKVESAIWPAFSKGKRTRSGLQDSKNGYTKKKTGTNRGDTHEWQIDKLEGQLKKICKSRGPWNLEEWPKQLLCWNRFFRNKFSFTHFEFLLPFWWTRSFKERKRQSRRETMSEKQENERRRRQEQHLKRETKNVCWTCELKSRQPFTEMQSPMAAKQSESELIWALPQCFFVEGLSFSLILFPSFPFFFLSPFSGSFSVCLFCPFPPLSSGVVYFMTARRHFFPRGRKFSLCLSKVPPNLFPVHLLGGVKPSRWFTEKCHKTFALCLFSEGSNLRARLPSDDYSFHLPFLVLSFLDLVLLHLPHLCLASTPRLKLFLHQWNTRLVLSLLVVYEWGRFHCMWIGCQVRSFDSINKPGIPRILFIVIFSVHWNFWVQNIFTDIN